MRAGLYIHIPFCKKKCNYCDFYSLGGNENVPQRYVEQVIKEVKKYSPLTCKTVYFGGGTPSLLTPRQVGQILSCLDIEEGAEITLEGNPESLTLEKLKGYRRQGVNRLSIGVQTVKDTSLQTLGRLHSALRAEQVFHWAKQAGFTNISGDLMIGLDDYSTQELFDTIDFLEAGDASHISAYMLKVEEGTPFYQNRPKNLSTEDELADFYLLACEYLEQKGYTQYEISNFAKDGAYSRHNTIYWKLENYLGIGPGAHSCVDGQRFYYPRDLKQFMENPQTIPDGKVDADDYIMLSLRLNTGLDLKELEEKWGVKIPPQGMKMLDRFVQEGFVTMQNGCVSLTPKGFLVENAIASEIMKYS